LFFTFFWFSEEKSDKIYTLQISEENEFWAKAHMLMSMLITGWQKECVRAEESARAAEVSEGQRVSECERDERVGDREWVSE